METSNNNHTITGTIIFSTVGRCDYGFDVFSLPLDNPSPANEHCLTDGISINFNGQFIDDDRSLVFISERTGASRVYLKRPGSTGPPEELPSAPGSLFHDRPIVHNNRLFFVSAHEPADLLYKSWSSVYSVLLNKQENEQANKISRLTPYGVADFSPAVSPSGSYIAVASHGSKPWGGEFRELDTQIVVFPVADPTKRTVLANRGGWPTWSGDSTVYFHRQSEDGWWSIYRVNFPANDTPPTRVTPSGVHAFTPAAGHGDNLKMIAVATRRKGKANRHIELFDVESGEFKPVTEGVNPNVHHYNPFISPGSKFLGYHRFRGESNKKEIIPNLEAVQCPIKSLKMLRCNGFFPSFSRKGDLVAYNPSSFTGLKVMKSDGSKSWTLIQGRVAFCHSWSPNKGKHVIFTSLGPIFQPPQTTVQVARVEFDSSSLDPSRADVTDNVEIKIMTKEDTGNNAFPACSPDGKFVVFRSGRSGHKNLYIMDAEKGELNGIRQLTDGPWIDTMPNWSPDGELIAFSSNRHDTENPFTFGLYLVRPDGSDLKRVQVEGSSDMKFERINHVCFSPSGEWMLFTASMGGVIAEPVSFPNQYQPYGELFIVRVDGSGLRRLTWNGYENGIPTWHSTCQLDVDIGRLSLNGDAKVDGEQLKGQIDELLWMTCDI